MSRRAFVLSLLVAGVTFVGCASAGRAGGSAAPVCTLTPFHCGVCYLGEDHVLGAGHRAEDRVPFVLYSFLIETSDGRFVLADLGLKSLKFMNEVFHRPDVGFFRPPDASGNDPDAYTQPHGNVLDQLKGRGIKPEQIEHVVYTHLHYDHNGVDDPRVNAPNAGLCADFPNAVHHISKKGWEANLATRKEGWRWSGYVDFDFSQWMLKAGERGKAEFEDDAVVVRSAPIPNPICSVCEYPGVPLVRTVYLGGHSVCSQAILVRTAYGTAIITSDDIYHYEFLQAGVMARLHTSPENLIAATDRLVDLAEKENGILLPIHEPLVWKAWEEHGEKWLEALKPVSDAAVKGYRAHRDHLRILRDEKAP